MKPDKEVTKKINPISIEIIILSSVIGALLLHLNTAHWTVIALGVIISLIVASSIRIADQWEKAVVLRMGKFLGLRREPNPTFH